MAAPVRRAAAELRYLLARGYPLEVTLSLVGNRHGLARRERDLLRRGVAAPQVAERRRAKLRAPTGLAGARLAIDGHNQLITLESALKGRPLVAADDGLVRDVERAARAFRPGRLTEQALGLLLELLGSARPESTLFLFDAPVSGSGCLAALVRRRLQEAGLVGEARAAAYPEAEMEGFSGVVATSDGPLIDACQAATDLSGAIIRAHFGHLLISLKEREGEP